jgi:hypothetical protein
VAGPKPSNPQGAAGSAGSASGTGNAGGAGAGGECGFASGAGNCIVTGGTGGGGTTGTGGGGGATPLPTCGVTPPVFRVCFVTLGDAGIPLPRETHMSGPATITVVGTGSTPVTCPREQTIGIGGQGPGWWLQARAADGNLWTIAVEGLGGNTPLVRTGDLVTLTIDWTFSYPVPPEYFANGLLQLSDAAGTPVLWAGTAGGTRSLPAAPTWISFTAGDYVCSGGAFCDTRQSNVIASVNGSSTTLPPYGAASVGGYFLQATTFSAQCLDSVPLFHAAAAKISPTTGP